MGIVRHREPRTTQSELHAEASLVTAGSGASAESGTAAASELVSFVNAGTLTAPSRAEAGRDDGIRFSGRIGGGSGVGDGDGAGGGGGTVCVGGSSGVGGAGGMVDKKTGVESAEGDSGTSASGSESGFGLLRSRVRIPQVHFWT